MRMLVGLFVKQTADQSASQTVQQSDRSLSSPSLLPLGLSQSGGSSLSFISFLNPLKCKTFSTLSPPSPQIKLATQNSLFLLLYLGWWKNTELLQEW